MHRALALFIYTAATLIPLAASVTDFSNEQLLCLVNAQRQQAGLKLLGLDPKLTVAAQQHSQDMATTQNMDHIGSDGSSPSDRISKAGFQWQSDGENVAEGQTSMQQVMHDWVSVLICIHVSG